MKSTPYPTQAVQPVKKSRQLCINCQAARSDKEVLVVAYDLHHCAEIVISEETNCSGPRCDCDCFDVVKRIFRRERPYKQCLDHADHGLVLCTYKFCRTVRHWYCARNIRRPHGSLGVDHSILEDKTLSLITAPGSDA